MTEWRTWSYYTRFRDAERTRAWQMEEPQRTYTWRVIQEGHIWLLQFAPRWMDEQPHE